MSKNSEKGYWLTIEPFVFIFQGKKEYILYNTTSQNVISIDTVEISL
ncbi:MAG: hypothetical protein FWH18_04670 [Marinilabiliaceae bacterium]|nr:hypothetical protein [Marinilabiliaceae bacterium]